jgi:hypothetical protein
MCCDEHRADFGALKAVRIVDQMRQVLVLAHFSDLLYFVWSARSEAARCAEDSHNIVDAYLVYGGSESFDVSAESLAFELLLNDDWSQSRQL